MSVVGHVSESTKRWSEIIKTCWERWEERSVCLALKLLHLMVSAPFGVLLSMKLGSKLNLLFSPSFHWKPVIKNNELEMIVLLELHKTEIRLIFHLLYTFAWLPILGLRVCNDSKWQKQWAREDKREKNTKKAASRRWLEARTFFRLTFHR